MLCRTHRQTSSSKKSDKPWQTRKPAAKKERPKPAVPIPKSPRVLDEEDVAWNDSAPREDVEPPTPLKRSGDAQETPLTRHPKIQPLKRNRAGVAKEPKKSSSTDEPTSERDETFPPPEASRGLSVSIVAPKRPLPFFLRVLPTTLPKGTNAFGLPCPHPMERELRAPWDETKTLPERLRPITRAQIVGNAPALRELEEWLDRKVASEARVSPSGQGRSNARSVGEKKSSPPRGGPRVLILWGPPGCGKSSAARAVLLDRGYHVVELSPANPQSTGSAVSHSHSLGAELKAVYEGTVFAVGKNALILEEVDGITTMDDLVSCVERTGAGHAPVIMTCNEPFLPSMRKLRECRGVKLIRFYPLWEEDMHLLLTRWEETLELVCPEDKRLIRWKKATALPTVKDVAVRVCEGDARRLLTQHFSLACDREQAEIQCEWDTMDRWCVGGAVERARLLTDLASGWQDARRWMAPFYRDDCLCVAARSDALPEEARSKFSDDWSDTDLLDSAWFSAASAEHSSCVQLLLLRKPTQGRSDSTTTTRRRTSVAPQKQHFVPIPTAGSTPGYSLVSSATRTDPTLQFSALGLSLQDALSEA